MIKEILFLKTLGLLLLSNAFTYAQTYKPKTFFGIHAAPTRCSYYSSSEYYSYKTKYHPGIGLIGGVSTQFNFSPRFAFHTELNYEQLNYSTSYARIGHDIIIGPYPVNRSVQSNFASLSLSFKYNFIKSEKTNLFLHLGNYWNYMFSQRLNFTLSDQTTRNIKAPNDNRLRMGLLSGIGIDRAITDCLHLTVEIRDHFTMVDDPDGYLNSTNTVFTNKSNSIGVMFGLLFLPRR